MNRLFVCWLGCVLMCTVATAQEESKSTDRAKPAMERQQRPARPARKLEVKDPREFIKPGAKPVFSGPQSGESLPSAMVRGLSGEVAGTEFELRDHVGKTPHVLVFMDENGAGVRGMFGFVRTLTSLAAQSNADLRMTAVFLGDDANRIKNLTDRFVGRIPPICTVAVSDDGRDGPGSYGLNRNVSMSVLLVQDQKVVHSFAMPQSMLYPDPHVLGGIAEILGVDQEKMTRWLNVAAAEQPRMNRQAAAERQNMESKRRMARRPEIVVKDPAEFSKIQNKTLFSGPQIGETLPAISAMGIQGDQDGEAFDVVKPDQEGLQVLIFQDQTPVGLRGLLGLSRSVALLREKSEQSIPLTSVMLADDATQMAVIAKRVLVHLPKGCEIGISPDGRDGPGSYGLNRNVAMTVILARDGKVVRNFPFPQGMVSPDAHVLGGLAELIGEEREVVADWLRQSQRAGETMRRR